MGQIGATQGQKKPFFKTCSKGNLSTVCRIHVRTNQAYQQHLRHICKQSPIAFETFSSRAMAGIDRSQGKLVFPPRFIPYLEKHRIFELFHELAELLIQEKPKDHVKFLRSVLPCAAKRRDKPRVVFFAPPSFDRVYFAKEIRKILDIPAIARFHLEMKTREERMRKREEGKVLFGEGEQEEYSCVCPGEYEFGESVSPYQPRLHPAYFDEDIEAEKRWTSDLASVSAEEEEEKAEKEEDPCKGMRVCPCKVGQAEGEEGKSTSTEVVKTEDLDTETEQRSVKATPTAESRPGKETDDLSTVTTCVCESSEETVVDYGILGRCEYAEKGWILIDFPADAEEAERLSEQGAIPTHAIRIHTGEEEENERDYKYLSKGWATAYKSIPVTGIHVNGRSIPQVAESVGRLLRSMPHRHAPMLPRIALIGSRGSGASTQAKLLSTKYKIIHVDFKKEMSRVILQDDKYSEMYKRQLLTRPDPELEAAILEKTLLASKYQNSGWVITGFPTNIDQLRMFDLIATPPNRIIFIEVPAKECFIRLYYRQTDWANGREYTLPDIVPEGAEVRKADGLEPEVRHRLMPHPKDDKRLIIRDIEEYLEEKGEMMEYCGKTAAYVNGNKNVESVFEQIDHILINPSPAEPPRDPLAVGHGIREAYERLQSIRMENGFTVNNLLANPPDPIFKL